MNATQLKRKLEEAEAIVFLKYQNSWLCRDYDKIQEANKKIKLHNLKYNFFNGSFRIHFTTEETKDFNCFSILFL